MLDQDVEQFTYEVLYWLDIDMKLYYDMTEWDLGEDTISGNSESVYFTITHIPTETGITVRISNHAPTHPESTGRDINIVVTNLDKHQLGVCPAVGKSIKLHKTWNASDIAHTILEDITYRMPVNH